MTLLHPRHQHNNSSSHMLNFNMACNIITRLLINFVVVIFRNIHVAFSHIVSYISVFLCVNWCLKALMSCCRYITVWRSQDSGLYTISVWALCHYSDGTNFCLWLWIFWCNESPGCDTSDWKSSCDTRTVHRCFPTWNSDRSVWYWKISYHTGSC